MLDFGIAKLQQASAADSVKTRTGTLMGTPLYMSPEQCRGTQAVDHRSDIYSLGVILYEMLGGQPPFVSEGFGELVNMHLNVAPASARSKRPDIPPALDALVMKMLAKKPDDRFADMAEVQRALKASGGSQFTVQSSPDLAKTHAPKPAVTQTSPMHDTTFGAPPASAWARRRPGCAAGQAGARRRGSSGRGGPGVPGAGGGGGEMKTLSGPIGIVKPNPPPGPPRRRRPRHKPPTPTPTPTPPPPPAPRKVELRLVSVPAGARVLDADDGAVLGTTPLVLTRSRGGNMKFRFEKDGYGPSTRTMDLNGDQTLELTLEQKAKSKPRPHRPRAIRRQSRQSCKIPAECSGRAPAFR